MLFLDDQVGELGIRRVGAGEEDGRLRVVVPEQREGESRGAKGSGARVARIDVQGGASARTEREREQEQPTHPSHRWRR
jgi:hypothetical protein